MTYFFTLRDNNERAYNLFVWFLFFFHVVIACIFVLNTNDSKVRISIYVLLGFYALLGIVYLFYKTHKRALETFSLVMALLYANFWFQQVGILAMLVFAVIYITGVVVKGKRTTVLISDDGIELTRVFKTVVLPWSGMANVVLKDNLLTLDFKTNKILQVEIIESGKAVDEAAFNRFCDEQLNSGDLL